MKVAVVFVLLFATVLCRPAKKVSLSSSESSEEVVKRPAAQPLRKKAVEVPQYRAAPVQNVVAAAAPESDESAESSDEDEQAAALELKSEITDTTSSPDTATVDSQDSEDSDDDDDDDDDAEETEEDDTSESTESGESSTPAPATLTPVIVTEEPVAEATAEPIEPTIVTDDAARGDSLGGYPSDYKSIVYVEEKTYHKIPSPYKSYEYMGTGKKMANDMTEDNEVDKSMKVYKALQVHNEIVEEDTSTPDVESQGLDASSGTAQDQDTRQAALPEEEESASASDATTSESSSAPEEEEEEESASNSASQESEDDDSQSSEEATATPGAADSDSDESDESDEVAAPDATTDMPAVITAK
ncbi:osteopontin isoform X2 [Sebastes umbrosus]|uniref:osteopontin isoform X2 n=1 Tax=Sebastes umbrosus TaxID=72105 RepID=UPI00189DA9CE|nr:osteopontin isoform X2 [Sebastes umbrosus]